jgi:hypothetical protein
LSSWSGIESSVRQIGYKACQYVAAWSGNTISQIVPILITWLMGAGGAVEAPFQARETMFQTTS